MHSEPDYAPLRPIIGAGLVGALLAASAAVAAADAAPATSSEHSAGATETAAAPESHPHLLEIGNSVPICVYGPNFVSTCAFGGFDLRSAYLYRFHKWFAVGLFFDVGFELIFDVGVKLRAWLFTEVLYFDLAGMFMMPPGAIYQDFRLYGLEAVLGLGVPAGRRVRFVVEAQAPLMFSQYGFIGFLRAMLGVSISI
jgi:hypothetical protein